jgi:hypothetical protein
MRMQLRVLRYILHCRAGGSEGIVTAVISSFARVGEAINEDVKEAGSTNVTRVSYDRGEAGIEALTEDRS